MKFGKKHELKLDLGTQIDSGELRLAVGDLAVSKGMIEQRDAYSDGIRGQFLPIANDFSSLKEADFAKSCKFIEGPHWTGASREKVRRFRYVICLMALASVALSLMSRMILNIAIVDMVLPVECRASEIDVTTASPESDIELLTWSSETPEETTTTMDQPSEQEEKCRAMWADYEAGLRFDWSQKDQNGLLGSFYIGYMPAILFSGGIADKYGGKYPLLLAVLGSSVINLVTPLLARYSYAALFASRMTIGIIQGGVVPSLYDTFNKWLTANEASMFVPLIKVSMPLGSLLGAVLPGLATSLELKWTSLFYFTSLLCLLWSLAWIISSSPNPQTSKFIDAAELHKIIRKKQDLSCIATIDNRSAKKGEQPPKKNTSTPWLKIVTNPSVLALTFLKYTYNISMDFFYIELGLYLDNVHKASPQVRSLIASSGYLMQMLFIAFVAWSAKTVVSRQVFGLSVTKWRKIYQGSSNFAMAAIYFLFPFLATNLSWAAFLILAIWFFWMLGAGGESLVPYDLSTKYPAAIVGFAHSVSIFSGLSVPVLCNFVLGEDFSSITGWNTLCFIMGTLATLGGLVFVLVLKSKPFLREERSTMQNGVSSGFESVKS